MTSYCDVVSQEVSSVSGVTDMSSSGAEYSEVDDAAFRLRFISVYFRNCSRDDHIIGFRLSTPFVTVHCRSVCIQDSLRVVLPS